MSVCLFACSFPSLFVCLFVPARHDLNKPTTTKKMSSCETYTDNDNFS